MFEGEGEITAELRRHQHKEQPPTQTDCSAETTCSEQCRSPTDSHRATGPELWWPGGRDAPLSISLCFPVSRIQTSVSSSLVASEFCSIQHEATNEPPPLPSPQTVAYILPSNRDWFRSAGPEPRCVALRRVAPTLCYANQFPLWLREEINRLNTKTCHRAAGGCAVAPRLI